MEYAVNFDIGLRIPHNVPLNKETFPNLAYAMDEIALHGLGIWQGYAMGRAMPNGRTIKPRSGAYMRSIHIVDHGPFYKEIRSNSPYAESIEGGTEAYDMKRMLQTSHKTRISKKGKRYLIIPFRHKTSGALNSAMPLHVHEAAMVLRPSRVKSSNRRQVATSVRGRALYLTNRTYRWGDRLPAGMTSKLKSHHKTDIHAGMVKMQDASKGSTTYMTFRVMSEDSKGWLRAAVPGAYPAKQTADKLIKMAEDAGAKAVEADVRALVGGMLG